MTTKTLVYLGIALGGLTGGWLGSFIDNGNPFGLWGILFSTIGGLIGIWLGYKIGTAAGQ